MLFESWLITAVIFVVFAVGAVLISRFLKSHGSRELSRRELIGLGFVALLVFSSAIVLALISPR